MTKIDFHTNVADKITYTCRLVRKARTAALESRIIILLRDKSELAALDQALWTFSAQDFLPHASVDEAIASQSPVVLTDSDSRELPHHDILVNLSGTLPTSFAQFERVFEIITQEPTDTEVGRERYGYYRQRGYAFTHFVASQS